MGYVTLCIEALTFHVPGVFETKCEAAPALGEHITLDDPFAEMTAPAEAGNIVKGDEVSPDPTDLQDVFVCTVLFFLDSSYSIRFLIVFLSLLLATFGLLCSHKARLLRSLCTVSQYLFGITSPSRFLGRFRKAPLKTMWPSSL